MSNLNSLTEKFLQFSFLKDAKIKLIKSDLIRINKNQQECKTPDIKSRLAKSFNSKAQISKASIKDPKLIFKFKCKILRFKNTELSH